MLRKIVQELNARGISVDLDALTLSRFGWKAENFCYYSGLSDDLEPVFCAEVVYVMPSRNMAHAAQDGAGFEIDARAVRLNPSSAWCVGVPESSHIRDLERMRLRIGVNRGRVVIQDAHASWCGVELYVDGRAFWTPSDDPEHLPDFLPLVIDPAVFERFDQILCSLLEKKSGVVRVQFRLDQNHSDANQIRFSASADGIDFAGVELDLVEVVACYENNRVLLDRALLCQDGRSLLADGAYERTSGAVELHVQNSLAAPELLTLLPENVQDLMELFGLKLTTVPAFDMRLGPGLPEELLNRVSGSFEVLDAEFRGLHFSSCSSRVTRKAGRLDLTEIKAILSDQTEQSMETGSCMLGGTASGSFFWDAGKREIGCNADGCFDPTLLIPPLSDVRVATNILHRFQCDRETPQAHVEFGFQYQPWSEFFFNLQGSGNDLRYRGVPFTSISASLEYRDMILEFDSLLAQQGIDFCKGMVSFDFRNHLFSFDGDANMNPATLESVVFPRGEVFGNAVRFEGPARMHGSGTIDWREMKATDFRGEVAADRVELPMMAMDDFKCSVIGDGPVIQLDEMTFGLYSGTGMGTFSVLVDPSRDSLPCKVEVGVNKADFSKFIHYVYPELRMEATGELYGWIKADADIADDLLESAKGAGRVDIRHGQLADLPLFRGFSSTVRKLFPSFRAFSITRLNGDFEIHDGIVSSDNAYFDGDVISAKGRGAYSFRNGFNAYVQAQVLSDNSVSRIFRFLTDPLLKLFEMKLSGMLPDPKWELGALASDKENDANE
ncbi:MAG: hypothetical protein JXR25_06240 [Pontiellaceae bacterium]|nr:hypothetical protein [Pontiellaceae bacterium]MBN2784408.1 hypothetical protein [Pontiellaceae bacterium]